MGVVCITLDASSNRAPHPVVLLLPPPVAQSILEMGGKKGSKLPGSSSERVNVPHPPRHASDLRDALADVPALRKRRRSPEAPLSAESTSNASAAKRTRTATQGVAAGPTPAEGAPSVIGVLDDVGSGHVRSSPPPPDATTRLSKR